MNVSTGSSNNYQMMNQYQVQNQPTTQPTRGTEPKLSNSEVYELTEGNAIRNDEVKVALTPQGEVNRDNAQETKAAEEAATAEAKRDEQRANGADYIARQSKKSQVEIYLAVATEGKVDSEGSATASILESLRDVQKQNNTVQAYATYQENQNAPVNNLTRGLAG